MAFVFQKVADADQEDQLLTLADMEKFETSLPSLTTIKESHENVSLSKRKDLHEAGTEEKAHSKKSR